MLTPPVSTLPTPPPSVGKRPSARLAPFAPRPQGTAWVCEREEASTSPRNALELRGKGLSIPLPSNVWPRCQPSYIKNSSMTFNLHSVFVCLKGSFGILLYYPERYGNFTLTRGMAGFRRQGLEVHLFLPPFVVSFRNVVMVHVHRVNSQ